MADTVRASVQTGPRTHELRELPRPRIGENDALMRVEACGVCGSDVEQYEGSGGRRPGAMIPGHEPLGVIEEIGPTASRRWGVKAGDRVAVESYLPCRACDMCARGELMSCRTGRFSYGYTTVDTAPGLWGGYAEYLYLHPNTLLHKVRNDIPAEVAVLYNPLGAGVRWAAHLGGVKHGDTVLVLGAGQRGITSVIAAKAAGATTVIVTGLGRDADKLALAREFGANHTINVETDDTVSRVREITDGKLCDVVVDVTPMALDPVNHAIECVRHNGRVVLAGLKGRRPMQFGPDAVIQKGCTIVGAFGVDSFAYAEAIALIESERFPLEKLHTHTFSLAETPRAIEALSGHVSGRTAVCVSVDPRL